MTPGTRYPHPPITEAVIDIQCTGGRGVADLEKVNTAEPSYPSTEKLFATKGQVLIGSDSNASASVSSKAIGFLHRSNDGLQIYQAHLNGFTFSRLAEYTSWGEVSREARRLWDKYRAVAAPTSISRIALRYVNRLDIPLPLDDFSRYLRTAPQLSSELGPGLTGYFMQLQLPLPDTRTACIINQTIIEPSKPNTVAVVLDIDVFSTSEVLQDEEHLWKQLEHLRGEKNRVFEACITDEARRLFQ
jgi:uncharacterized protein (TIGR04255 family)